MNFTATCANTRGAWDQSPLFKKIYEEEFGQLGGQPFGCLIGDYYFNHLPTDVQCCATSARSPRRTCPFVCSGRFGLRAWTPGNELMNPRDLSKLFDTPEYAAWKSLRDSDDAKYVGL